MFQQLQKEARWNSLEEAANRLAYYKSELNMLHPFRKGNDRTIRIFIHAFAKSRGVEWSYETMDREKYLNVMIRATHDTQPLQQLFFETISYIE